MKLNLTLLLQALATGLLLWAGHALLDLSHRVTRLEVQVGFWRPP